MEIIYRPGKKEDCGTIAELISMASDGVVEFLFHELVPGMLPVQVVADSLLNENDPHSYKSTMVAVDGNTVVGMALSFPSEYHKITEEMRSFFPKDRLDHLTDLYASRVKNSLYLDALGVIKSHRRQGIGEKLISLTREKATQNGFNALSLIVFTDNQKALPLYKRTGFKVVQKVKLGGNEFIKHDHGCLLMKCELKHY